METGWTKMAVGSQYNTMNANQIQQYYNDAFKNFAEIMPAAANEYSEYYLGKPLTDATSFANEFTPMYFWNPGSDIDTNWKDQVYRTGMITDHQVGISGGTDKTKFYAGFGYNKTKGIVAGSDFERFSGRINVDHQAYKWLNLSLDRCFHLQEQTVSVIRTTKHKELVLPAHCLYFIQWIRLQKTY